MFWLSDSAAACSASQRNPAGTPSSPSAGRQEFLLCLYFHGITGVGPGNGPSFAFFFSLLCRYFRTAGRLGRARPPPPAAGEGAIGHRQAGQSCVPPGARMSMLKQAVLLSALLLYGVADGASYCSGTDT